MYGQLLTKRTHFGLGYVERLPLAVFTGDDAVEAAKAHGTRVAKEDATEWQYKEGCWSMFVVGGVHYTVLPILMNPGTEVRS